jgi:uncharacterized membrane protein
MEQPNDKYRAIAEKLQQLIEEQNKVSDKINTLKSQLDLLRNKEQQKEIISKPISDNKIVSKKKKEEVLPSSNQKVQFEYDWPPARKKKHSKKAGSFNFEQFIGESLISKIGIVILLIGVAIGSKYAIEHKLLDQLTRIILGYMLGTGLLFFAVKLRKNYNAFSAVLVSGALAIYYFITYAAYAFYHLIPLPVSYIMLFVFTVFAVVAAITYSKQVIAHIGLVGAYAIPLLLIKDSENISFLLSYTALINLGILIIAINRYWKHLYLSAFVITWLLMLIWINTDYTLDNHFALACSFSVVFFLLFFITFLIYKLIRKTTFAFLDVLLVVLNSFVFFGIGYALIKEHNVFSMYTGLFALLTAFLHFLFSYVVYKNQMGDKNLFFLISGLVLTFLTISFPIQLNGSWVTLLWAGETVFLFWIGRSNKVKFYEYLSYLLSVLTFFSLVHDWSMLFDSGFLVEPEKNIRVFLNIHFLTSVVVMAVYVFIFWLDRLTDKNIPRPEPNEIRNIMRIVAPLFLIITAYTAISLEISAYWNQLYSESEITLLTQGEDPYPYSEFNSDLKSYKTIWLVNFTLLFLSVLSFFNRILKNKEVICWVNQGINVIAYFICFSLGLWEISELRESYLEQELAEYYHRGFLNIAIRYISVLFLATFIVSSHRLHIYLGSKFKVLFDTLLASAVLWFLSSELFHWLDIFKAADSYKLAISLFWGIFALALVAFGIWKRNKHLRILSFVILGFTLLKMFFYDLSHLDTLSRAAIFIVIGLLMLGVSFLYNKFKNLLFDDATN